jgi:hypothetical protein
MYKAQVEAGRQQAIVQSMKLEIMRCLAQTSLVVRQYSEYHRVINVVLIETGRIFLAGHLTTQQVLIETESKQRLFNLRATEYACVVMASITPGKSYVFRTPTKNNAGKIMSGASTGVTGAYIGFMVGGPVGAAIGGGVGFIVGLGMEFF